MSQPKDYDPTLARIAGNIGAGLVSPTFTRMENEQAVDLAFALAQRLITHCRKAFQENA